MAVPTGSRTGCIGVGSFVRVRDEDGELAVEIVGPEEAEATAGRISTDSPLRRALLERCAGDLVRFGGPGGVLTATVIEIGR